MIVWKDNKAGFVGASKRLIKGFFTYTYSVTTADVEPPEVPQESGSVGSNRKLTATSLNRKMTVTNTNRKMSFTS